MISPVLGWDESPRGEASHSPLLRDVSKYPAAHCAHVLRAAS